MLRRALEQPVKIVSPARDRGFKACIVTFFDRLDDLLMAGKK